MTNHITLSLGGIFALRAEAFAKIKQHTAAVDALAVAIADVDTALQLSIDEKNIDEANALAATATLVVAGSDAATAVAGIEAAPRVPGRLDRVDAGQDFLDGGTGTDSIDGGTEADSILGDAGIDTIAGGIGADTIRAGNDNDTNDGLVTLTSAQLKANFSYGAYAT